MTAVVDQAMETAPAEPGAPVEQLTLGGLIPAEQVVAGYQPGAPVRRSAGRPVGAVDKRTAAWRDFVLARYPHPLVALAETWSRPVDQLAAELGCTALEAHRQQLKAVEAALPYLERRMPQEVAVSSDGAMVLQMVVSAGMVAGAVDRHGMPISATVLPVENPDKSVTYDVPPDGVETDGS